MSVYAANDRPADESAELATYTGPDPMAERGDARDLAEWTIRTCEARAFGAFNATGPAQPLTIADMLKGVAQGVKVTPRVDWVATHFLQDKKVYPWSDLPVWIPGQGETAGFARR